ncbi:hypothetical protein EJ06DRAFT_529473 [Trichodelitschia bisporula]|uniref:Uncharacterized protein n=1 Tax=Trichodelitschia bisporula TaxID=703511 RepID=A0A6G1HZA5_9PEZI|nr:hypothetical protein EJ06DRAFT_529473 [Trichodelitschia bisporula]
MQHYAPHLNATFEGYYSRFMLPSGASLALIVCSVPKAAQKPHMLSFTYVPSGSSNIFQRELWVESIERIPATGSNNAFRLLIPGIGYVACSADSTMEYSLDSAEFSLHATTKTRTPWSKHQKSPEGWLAHLPLPLHWHVHSVASECEFSLSIPSIAGLPEADTQGMAVVHQEKNWAQSFPDAHIWVQARKGFRGFCCAGGSILGMEAFLLPCNLGMVPIHVSKN